MSALQAALTEVESKAKAIDEIYSRYEADPTKAFSDEDQKKHDELKGQLHESQAVARRLKDREETQNEIKGILKDSNTITRPQLPGNTPKADEPRTRKSIGQRFVESKEFSDWLKDTAPNGTISESMKGLNSPPVQFKADLIVSTGTSDAGAFVVPDFKGTVTLPFVPIDILDLITVGTTGSDTVEYPRVTGMTNRAAGVVQASDETDTSGIKPSSTMAFARISTTVKTIAHWIPATKRAISDAGQLRTLIDAFLLNGLKQVLADLIVNGDNTGEEFDGLLHVSGTTPQPFDTDLITTSRKALTTCRVVALTDPTGFLMSPETWEDIDLAKDGQGRYYFGGPVQAGTRTLWGIPVAQENKMPNNSFITGDLKQAVLWNREQSSIQVSDSHADFFVRNLVAILAEQRAAFGVLRPAAIVIGDTGEGAGSSS